MARRSVNSSDLPPCPYCCQVVFIISYSKNRSGSRRYRCRACKKNFTPNAKGICQYSNEYKVKAHILYSEFGIKSMRNIAKCLGVSHQTVNKWILNDAAKLEVVFTEAELAKISEYVNPIGQEILLKYLPNNSGNY